MFLHCGWWREIKGFTLTLVTFSSQWLAILFLKSGQILEFALPTNDPNISPLRRQL